MKKKEIVIVTLLAAGLVGFFLLLPRPAPVAQADDTRAADKTPPTFLLFRGVRLFDGGVDGVGEDRHHEPPWFFRV